MSTPTPYNPPRNRPASPTGAPVPVPAMPLPEPYTPRAGVTPVPSGMRPMPVPDAARAYHDEADPRLQQIADAQQRERMLQLAALARDAEQRQQAARSRVATTRNTPEPYRPQPTPTRYSDDDAASARLQTANANAQFDLYKQQQQALVPRFAEDGSRTMGEIAGDVLAGFAGGGNELFQTVNFLEDRLNVVKMAMRAASPEWAAQLDADYAARQNGLREQKAQIQEFKSPQQRAAEQAVKNAKGFGGAVEALWDHPSAALNGALEIAVQAGPGAGAAGLGARAAAFAAALMGTGSAGTGAENEIRDKLAEELAKGPARLDRLNEANVRSSGNIAATLAGPVAALLPKGGQLLDTALGNAAQRIVGSVLTTPLRQEAAKLATGLTKDVVEGTVNSAAGKLISNTAAINSWDPGRAVDDQLGQAIALGAPLNVMAARLQPQPWENGSPVVWRPPEPPQPVKYQAGDLLSSQQMPYSSESAAKTAARQKKVQETHDVLPLTDGGWILRLRPDKFEHPQPLPGDILNSNDQPFTQAKFAAAKVLQKRLVESHRIIPMENDGWVLRRLPGRD
ncbi:hypothetical protein IGB42_04162 [Andreprevotia sp. IGB-42]|uniref:hypothetical protein n=1 Tax=Andreprevotia sp. IGB-42 TaxID=2497473 RepID=UPI001356DE90|nr:hypothetical protein [Andreprevotia sp. IGB-42]KAF0811396.1 hypothetical protein IGB42_04162 [Andreprevotia sp. IGB-42]